jgi:prevent-host-death family protein
MYNIYLFWKGAYPMEKKLGVTEARKQFSTIVEQVEHRGDTYIINRYGKPAAAVVPVEVYETWRRQRAAFFERIRSAQHETNLTPEEAEQLAAEAVSATRDQA